jgi:hypothetical protein
LLWTMAAAPMQITTTRAMGTCFMEDSLIVSRVQGLTAVRRVWDICNTTAS